MSNEKGVRERKCKVRCKRPHERIELGRRRNGGSSSQKIKNKEDAIRRTVAPKPATSGSGYGRDDVLGERHRTSREPTGSSTVDAVKYCII